MVNLRTTKTYEPLDVVQIPIPIPEAEIEAGDVGVVDSVYDEGKMLLVEVSRFDNPVIVVLDIEVKPNGTLSVVGYSTFGS